MRPDDERGPVRCFAKRAVLTVRPARFELATYGFEVRYSVQLSYGRTVMWYTQVGILEDVLKE